MGCKPSKNTSTVHPSNSSNIITVQESPDAPSSTPEPPSTSQGGADLSPEVNGNHQLAVELQQRLQSQSTRTRNGKPKLQRQSTVQSEGEDDEDYIDGDYGGVVAQENTGWTRNTGNETDSPVDYTNGTGTDSLFNGRPVPSKPLSALPQNSLLKFRCGTDSQIEFFKMLDKKIDEGPDYEQDSDES